jgi:4-hydroxybenzoate polyprenyltransferase
MNLRYLLKSLRPKQWVKNSLVFAGIIFSPRFFDLNFLLIVIYAFIIFCFLSSAGYLINDIKDMEFDQKHPTKKNRPIASGVVNIPIALILAITLLTVSIIASFYLNFSFALVAISYLILMLLYTFLLKNVVIIDVFSIAAGFVLRLVAGVVVIGEEVVPWPVVCIALLALFIALGKRRYELVTLAHASQHRRILESYRPQLLDQLISMTAGLTILAYALYTLWPETVAKYGTHNLVYTVPFVLYGIFRYLYIIYNKEEGGQPEKILVTDVPLLLTIVGWIISVLIIVHLFKS